MLPAESEASGGRLNTPFVPNVTQLWAGTDPAPVTGNPSATACDETRFNGNGGTAVTSRSYVIPEATGVPIPANYPVVGDDAFRTATGVHAAAIIKAYHKDDVVLANTVYSGVPSHVFGMEQIIDIGPMSGKSNVIFWLEKRGIQATEERVNAIYNKAKQSDRLLTTEEVLQAIHVSSVRDKRNVI